ncbi:hypothetical protein AAIB33_00550 [Microbacterium sp. AZCO]|uniref:hypothetical protein n=1 Tax=Microbacterium sp. AZCO TaxID=3142976 RepID=UPI0031F45D1B
MAISRAAGRVLRLLFATLLLVRRPRPIHARGRMLEGRITWLGNPVRSGIVWIDGERDASVPVVARLSRGIGLPPVFPDIIGLALRLDVGGRPADLELASTGFGVPGRFMLVPHRSPARATLGTLVPYRGPSGPVLVCARTLTPPDLAAGGQPLDAALSDGEWRLRLYHAGPARKWHPFADLSLREAPDRADDLRFDAVVRPIPGAGSYRWVRAARQPSYDLTQREQPAHTPAKSSSST